MNVSPLTKPVLITVDHPRLSEKSRNQDVSWFQMFVCVPADRLCGFDLRFMVNSSLIPENFKATFCQIYQLCLALGKKVVN